MFLKKIVFIIGQKYNTLTNSEINALYKSHLLYS